MKVTPAQQPNIAVTEASVCKKGIPMFYVTRDSTGEILTISRDVESGGELVDERDPAVLAFLGERPDPAMFDSSDAEFVRVIEDVIDTLIQNNVIRLTDLPVAAQRKLMTRKGIRNAIGGALNLIGNDDMIL